MLSTIIKNHQNSLAGLAKAWSNRGAHSFAVADRSGKPLLQWPNTPHDAVAASAPLKLNGVHVGELQLTGTIDPQASLQLTAEARLLSALLQLEGELGQMTGELIDQQDQLMALHQLAQSIRLHSDMQQNLTDLARITAQLLKTEQAFMLLCQDGQPAKQAIFPEQSWSETAFVAIFTLLAKQPEQNLWLFDHKQRVLRQLPVPMRNLLVKKLQVRPGISLVLGAANKIGSDFQAPDLKLFSTIAEPAVANLENAILHEEMLTQARIQTEMALAKQVQMQLLPQATPHISGLELAAYSRPASHVGGDFYDFIVDHNQLLTFTLGDVSGKGMPAALLMTMLRTVLRGKTNEQNNAMPEHLLNMTNESLYDDFSKVSMFATVFLGQYDSRQHLLHYANNGHAPVIYRPAQGAARLLMADAPPLGVLPVGLAERHTLDFAPGDLLIVASDGFTEAENCAGEMFGYERLLHWIDAVGDETAGELKERLFATIDDFSSGQAQFDDQTLLILRRTNADHRAVDEQAAG